MKIVPLSTDEPRPGSQNCRPGARVPRYCIVMPGGSVPIGALLGEVMKSVCRQCLRVPWDVPGWHCWHALNASTLLALALASPTPLRAECGDYVHTGNTAGSLQGERSLPLPMTVDPKSGQHGADPPSPKPRPCHGPTCSRRNLPPIAPASSASSGPEDRAFVHFTHECPSPTLGYLSIAQSPCHLGRYVGSVFRPPRSSVNSDRSP